MLYPSSENLLPVDGVVRYFGALLSEQQADEYFAQLMHEVDWQHDQVRMFGKLITTKRKIGWYGDKPFGYTYSQMKKTALPWTPGLSALKSWAEQVTGHTYNSCLANLYHDGSEGMAWHSDAEKMLLPRGAIASISLGAERVFGFKHQELGTVVKTSLAHGSLLVMEGATQEFWKHRLAPTKKTEGPRINLTFRTIVA